MMPIRFGSREVIGGFLLGGRGAQQGRNSETSREVPSRTQIQTHCERFYGVNRKSLWNDERGWSTKVTISVTKVFPWSLSTRIRLHIPTEGVWYQYKQNQSYLLKRIPLLKMGKMWLSYPDCSFLECSFAYFWPTLITPPSRAASLTTFLSWFFLPRVQLHCNFPIPITPPSWAAPLQLSYPDYYSFVSSFAYNFPTLITPPSWAARLRTFLPR